MKRALSLLMSLGLMRVQAEDIYHLDPANTQISFDVQRFGMHWVAAHFRDLTGDLVVDSRGLGSRVDVTVRTASVDCDDFHWNERLRSQQWLDVRQFPQMAFHSSQVQYGGSGGVTVRGELTLHGVTQSVTLRVRQLDCSGTADTVRSCSFLARATIRRFEYGLPHGLWVGGDEVGIAIIGTGVRSAAVRPDQGSLNPP